MKTYANDNGLTYEILVTGVDKIELSATYNEPVYGAAVVHPTFTIDSVTGEGLSPSNFKVDEWNSGWYPYRYVQNGEIYGWRYDETFDRDSAVLSVRIEPDPYEGHLYNFGNTIVTLNGEKLDILEYDRDGYYIYAIGKPYDITPSRILLNTRTYTGGYDSGGSVSFDNVSYSTGQSEYFAKGTSVDIYAKANEGYEFAGWRNGYDGDFISMSNPLTITADEEEETYYAVFQQTVPASGKVSDTVDYTFDEATGTVTLIPTGSDGRGYADVGSYYSSPFYGNNKIKHVVFEEGMISAGDYLFQNNRIETISLPSTFEYVQSRWFEDCVLEGAGFTVAPGNETFTVVDGSLVEDGSVFVKFVRKPGQTEYELPESITAVYSQAFEEAVLDKLVLRGEGLWLHSYALDYAEINELIIEEGVKDVDNQRCSIGNSSITLPASLKEIDNSGGVIDSGNVKNIYVDSGSKYYSSRDGVLYEPVYKDNDPEGEQIGLCLYCYPRGRTDTSFTVSDDVTAISRYAFGGRETLKEITLPLSISELGDMSFAYLDGVTVTVKNPECVFETDPFYYSKNVTIRGVTGSTAQIYADEYGFTIESIGEGELPQKLPNPQNLRWDGTTAKWDPIPGIEGVRYEFKFYEDDGGSEPYNIAYYNTTITDGTTEWNDFIGRMPYTDQDYYFTVKASKSGYYTSETVWSPPGNGPIERKTAMPILEGDTLLYDTEVTAETPGVNYFLSYIMVYDMEGNAVEKHWYNSDSPSVNLRSFFFDMAIPYEKYKVSASLEMDYYGWTTDIVDMPEDQYIVYDYQELPKVDRIEVTLPEMVIGMKAHLPDGLILKSYSGTREVDGVYPDTSYYWNCFEYQEEEGGGLGYFGDEGIQAGKYSYSYRLAIEKRPGYNFADDIEIFVNGSKENVEITSISGSEFNIRYHYPIGTQPKVGIWKKEGGQWHYYDGDGNLITNAWAQDSGGWYWLGSDGNITKSKWVKADGKWYYMEASGYKAQNKWVKDSTGWCYLGEDGAMVTDDWAKDSKGYCWIGPAGYMIEKTQWIQVGSDWYHITNGYRDESKWMKDSKGWCYLGEDGKMLTNGWAKDSKGSCWVGPSGYMVTDTKWIENEGKRYYIKSGYMAVNSWAKDDTGWLYLGSDGQPVMSTWKKDSKGWCYLGADGYMVTNDWAKDSKGYCWIGSEGYMVEKTQWFKIGDDWYHITKGYRDQNKWMKDSSGWCWLTEDGSMLTNGFVPDSHGHCWIGSDGYMVEETRLVEYEGDTYYIKEGYMQTNCTVEIGGETYTFGEDGKLIP